MLHYQLHLLTIYGHSDRYSKQKLVILQPKTLQTPASMQAACVIAMRRAVMATNTPALNSTFDARVRRLPRAIDRQQ
jgi:hypothetical protein